jgi:hypothetical protein
MIEVFTARSGAPSLKIDGIFLHSPYDPAREAARFVEDSLEDAEPATVIVLGEGLGYVSKALRDAKPRAHQVLVFYSEEIHGASPPAHPGLHPTWHPGAGLALPDFLRRHLGELDVEGLRVIEWPPSARLFPHVARESSTAVRQVVQELSGTFATIAGAGRLWMRNSICNFLNMPQPLIGPPCAADRPVMIAAPGPGLEQAMPLISEKREAFDLWALPSSCAALRASGLWPDLVVMTDPGFYSMHHLHFDAPGCPLAMPLSAARGAWNLRPPSGTRVPLYLLAEPVFYERALLGAAGIDAPLIPPHGTVSATALDLALAFTTAPVILAGLDLCARDIASHARPNAFERLLLLQSNRCQPLYSLCYRRADQLHYEPLEGTHGPRTSPAMRTYAGWFNSRSPSPSRRSYRLLPSALPILDLVPLDAGGLRMLLKGRRAARGTAPWRPSAGFPSRESRRSMVHRIMAGWKTHLADPEPFLRAIDAPVAIDQMPLAYALAFMIEPRGLVECRKRLRREDAAGARSAAGALLERCASFLDEIMGKALDGG